MGLWLPHKVRRYACALELFGVVLEADEEDGLLLSGPLYITELLPQLLRPPVRDVGPIAGPCLDPPRIPQLQQSDYLTVQVLDLVDREELKGLTRDKAALACDLPLLARQARSEDQVVICFGELEFLVQFVLLGLAVGVIDDLRGEAHCTH